ncbi:hypothetical protein VaNZ11_000434 [Volvox africanus]|uniref:Uncharacterized protein n=1 Tax=Volvox africanus TaxID=51714 RepID=A0ABQ5RM80_9CHLO|nr:hypothetical protein VaNZ11_000434 [Volvox africanus]
MSWETATLAALVSTMEAGVIMLTTLFDISASIVEFMYREVMNNPREAVGSAIRVLGYAASRVAVGKLIEQDELRVFYKRPEELTSMTLSILNKEGASLRSAGTKTMELEKMVAAQNAQLAAKDALISQLRTKLEGANAGPESKKGDDARAQEVGLNVGQLKRTYEQLTASEAALVKQLEDLRQQFLALKKERDEHVDTLHATEAQHQQVLAQLNEQVAMLQQQLEAHSAQLKQQEIARLELTREALKPAVELITAPLQPKNSEWDSLLVKARTLKRTPLCGRPHQPQPSAPAAHTAAVAAISIQSELLQQQQQGHRSSSAATAAAVNARSLEAVTPVYHAGSECRLLGQSAPTASSTTNTDFEDIDTLYQIPKMPMRPIFLTNV